MSRFGFPPYLVKIVQSFLSNRFFEVYVNGSASVLKQVNAGIPQGSVLGPILYNIYTSDFPKLPACETAIYADDTAIFSSHELGLNIEINLQNAIKIVTEYYNKWKIKLNAEKVQSIFFSRKRKNCFLPSNQLDVCGARVNWETSVKYLGIHLDQRLTFKEHIFKTIKKLNIAIKMLYAFINRKSKLSNANKIIIYKVVFQSILLYGCQVWGNCAICHLKKLQVSQNKLLKMMLNLSRYHSTTDLHHQANVELISDRILKLTDTFLRNCDNTDNALINQLNV